MRLKFQSPTGMHDVLPEDQKYFKKIYDVVDETVSFYNFQKIETPALEETELFLKGIGLSTEVVQKQMFSFRTKGGDPLTLRPEVTAPLIRAYIKSGMQRFRVPLCTYTLDMNCLVEFIKPLNTDNFLCCQLISSLDSQRVYPALASSSFFFGYFMDNSVQECHIT